jgi:hypothetical protein
MAKAKSMSHKGERWTTPYHQGDSVELSGIIVKGTVIPNLFTIDALPFNNNWLRLIGLSIGDEGQRDEIVHFFQSRAWAPSGVVIRETFAAPSIVPHSVPLRITEASLAAEESFDESDLSPGGILATLESSDASAEDRQTAVLFAETVKFTSQSRPRFVSRLFDFARDQRFSRNDESITAVGAAVRKIAMNMDRSQFEDYADLFSRTNTDTLSCDIELELAKAIGWRLVASNIATAAECPKLDSALSELASDYLTPRLILQENYASIVMHAIISVALLKGSRQEEFIDRASKLRLQWFTELLAKRLADAAVKQDAVCRASAGKLLLLHNRLLAGVQ